MIPTHDIFVAGAGGIGRAVALLLIDDPEFNCRIFMGDISHNAIEAAAQWIDKGVTRSYELIPVVMPMEGSNEALKEAFDTCEIILDCLPGAQAPRMARFAQSYDMHYANLTEYVKETNEIVEIARDARKGYILQTGLAPGFINVLGHHLFLEFCKNHGVEEVDRIAMRVGALTQLTTSPHYYGFTWSPIGVATEYIKDAIVVRNGAKVTLPSLSERETLLIDGVRYEADLTSGGAANLPDALKDHAKKIDYKTIRYPGHYDWVKGVIADLQDRNQKIKVLEEKMLSEIPTVEDDVVVIYASVTGKDQYGRLRGMEDFFTIKPMQIGEQTLRAIQSTTAAPLAECARMLLSGEYSGVIFQSDLDTESFMNGSIVRRVYYPGQKSSVPEVSVA